MSQHENQIETQKEEVATLKNLLSASEKLLHMSVESIDYQVITDRMKELSGAWIVGLNTYEEGGTKSVTRAFSGVPSAIKQARKFSFPLTGKEWDIIPERPSRYPPAALSLESPPVTKVPSGYTAPILVKSSRR